MRNGADGMKVTISNEITIQEPVQEIMEWCKRELVLPNPDYTKKERMGLWVGNTPRTLQLYKTNGNSVILPIGALKYICPIIKSMDYEKSLDLADNGVIDYNASVSLYDYQEEAVDAMEKCGYGILQSPAGSGKTQMGIALAVKLKKKVLWLTHTQDLLKQSYDRASLYVDKSMLGTITAGKVNIGSGMTFATVQTLAKQDLAQYKYTWDVIIVDECHRVAGTPTAMTQFSKVINSLACRHKYGLSATVHRADGMIKCTYMLLGDVKHIVPDEKVKDKVMAVNIKRIDTNEDFPMDALDTDGTINYTRLISNLAEKTSRNLCIASNIIDEPDRYHLILSDRLAQLKLIYDMLPDDLKEKACIIDGTMTSKKGKAQREQAIEDMRAGRKHFLFASYKLAKEGLDIPRLDRLHLATPQKDYAIIVQSVGRIARTFQGKQQPVCFDYVDSFKMAENMYKARCRHYRKCGCILNEF
jgi:superfamily II DNA or RNA helicase